MPQEEKELKLRGEFKRRFASEVGDATLKGKPLNVAVEIMAYWYVDKLKKLNAIDTLLEHIKD